MNYIPLEQLKNAWIFRHKSLPIPDKDFAKIKPMTAIRANTLWDTFISKQVDHPDFFRNGDWAFDNKTWVENTEWEKTWDNDDTASLPLLVEEHISWDNNTVIYFCCSRNYVIETTWLTFKNTWKNFLFMDDGAILVGKKRKEVVQFLNTGRCKIGNRPL